MTIQGLPRGLLSSALIGAVASARSMTPMATIAAARLLGRRTPGQLVLLDRPLFKFGALAMGVGELLGDKMKSAPDRTTSLGMLARVMSAGIAGAALAPRGREQAGAVAAVATAVPLAYLTLAGRDLIGQAQTGTGKTAAYLISILTRFIEAPSPAARKPGAPRALIVAPTRELAVQIEHDALLLSQFVRPRIVTVFGGLDYVKQRSLLRDPTS